MAENRRRDFAWVTGAYASALLVAVGVIQSTPLESPLWLALAGDVAATLVIFGFSRVFRNSSFYDPYWSVVPPVLLLYWCAAYGVLDLRLGVLAILVFAWGVRLTGNWAIGWPGLQHQDWRYDDLQASSGRWYALVDLFGIQMLPTLFVFVGCVPIWLLTQQTAQPWNGLDWVWVVVGFGALYLEFRADNVLRAFRADPANQGQVLRHDVWALCRHPNYLGELGIWLAIALAGWAGSGSVHSWWGFAAMVGLFVFISIPMIDKRQLANKADYAAYKAEVPSLIPGLKLPL